MTIGLENVVEVVGCHAEGEVGDVIIGGVQPPPGETVWEQAQGIAKDQALRNFVLNEPEEINPNAVSLCCAEAECNARKTIMNSIRSQEVLL